MLRIRMPHQKTSDDQHISTTLFVTEPKLKIVQFAFKNSSPNIGLGCLVLLLVCHLGNIHCSLVNDFTVENKQFCMVGKKTEIFWNSIKVSVVITMAMDLLPTEFEAIQHVNFPHRFMAVTNRQRTKQCVIHWSGNQNSERLMNLAMTLMLMALSQVFNSEILTSY